MTTRESATNKTQLSANHSASEAISNGVCGSNKKRNAYHIEHNGTVEDVKMRERGENCQSATNGVQHKRKGEENGGDGKRIKVTDKENFLHELFQLILKEAIQKGTNEHSKVVEFVHPADLEQRLDLTLESDPACKTKLLDMCKKIIKYSVKSGHPHFFNQLYGGLDYYSLAGSWLTEALNTSQYTFEVAPVFTLMEKTVLGEMLHLIGFHDGDAIFCPGGSISNMYALNLARYQMFPDVKRTGLSGLPKLCIMTSEKGHYSMKKGAALLGIGMDNVLPVKTDKIGQMIPEELDKAIEKAKADGLCPFIVNATAGTTVLGAYDPLNAIADICEKHGLWMHVDGAWGGSVLLSDKLRYKMAGVERADSMAWNPHKMMGAPLQTAAFFTKHKDLLANCHSAKAKYLFQQDKFYDVSYDTGDKSVQCGRKVDVLKLWMMWKAKGSLQLARDIENLFHCASYLAQKLAATDGFRLVLKEPECTNVCFWYIPPSMRGAEETQKWWQKLSQVAPVIKKRMTEQGTMLIGYQPDGELPNFFRMVVSNFDVTEREMDFVVEEITRLGSDL